MAWFGRDIADEARVDRGGEGNRVDEEETRSEKELSEEKEGLSVAELGETGGRNETEECGGAKRGSKISSLAYKVLYCTITTFRESSLILLLLSGVVELCWYPSHLRVFLDRAYAHIHVGAHTAILVTIIYWALLSSPSTFATSYSAYSSTSQHILNAVVSLAETFALTSSPSATNSASEKRRKTNLPYIYLPITVVLLGLYLCVAYITNASQGVYGTLVSSRTRKRKCTAASEAADESQGISARKSRRKLITKATANEKENTFAKSLPSTSSLHNAFATSAGSTVHASLLL
ncbi:hypothetical protein CCMSSC00406_0007211 [Pleurotus cornucopiae]|uniref:Uncharacterized protein n=1 Tax=Pleurotus cornucopiae TaxID=5321 RepID=A0ACB7ITI4_PLECO|nr:hypothetical protein CCMSSC00406_0007211 [Pleurotus cornucopiae]